MKLRHEDGDGNKDDGNGDSSPLKDDDVTTTAATERVTDDEIF